jgi:HlyD family secretion protein
MTATVSVVTDRRDDVLSVPNAALRFRPEGMGPPGAGPRTQGAGGAGAGNRQRRGSDGEGPPSAQAQRTVYVLVNGKPEPRQVTTGITDGRVTEITGGELKEGENVIVSIAGANSGQQRGPRGGGFRIL